MRFQELTQPRLAAVDRANTLVVVPIAAVEQHGPHMPTGTDNLICTALAEAVERNHPERVLLTPTLWLGASAHHLRFGATLDAGLDNYIAILADVARSLLDDGFCRLLFLNGHGGNVDPLKVALRITQTEYPESLLVGGSYWSVADDLLREVLDGDHKSVGHACEFETSMILHLHPKLVDHERIADAGELVPDQMHGLFVSRDMWQRTASGCTGRPNLATAEKGARLFTGLIERLDAVVERCLAEPLGVEYTDFVF
ncbi:MAG: creatininase family protein [Planctomycetaceae bacterium]|nr:creatininase family protein [Planctomycetaceae bacterium]